jgi:hypothetical protein
MPDIGYKAVFAFRERNGGEGLTNIMNENQNVVTIPSSATHF